MYSTAALQVSLTIQRKFVLKTKENLIPERTLVNHFSENTYHIYQRKVLNSKVYKTFTVQIRVSTQRFTSNRANRVQNEDSKSNYDGNHEINQRCYLRAPRIQYQNPGVL